MATDSMWSARVLYDMLAAHIASKTFKLMYLKSGASSDAAFDFVSDVVAYECDVAGYSRQTLTNVTATLDTSNDRARLNADNPASQTLAAGNTIVLAVIFSQGADDATSPIWGFARVSKVTDGTAWAPSWSPSGTMVLQAG